jgi:hypothetical protein
VHSPHHALQFVCWFYPWSSSLGCRVGHGPPMQSPIGIGCICLVIAAFATALSPFSESTTRSRQRRRMRGWDMWVGSGLRGPIGWRNMIGKGGSGTRDNV